MRRPTVALSHRMKHLRLALVVAASAVGVVYAQDESRRGPPVDIPDFSNLDEYIYEPKSTATLGVRRLSGPKASFSGQGTIASPQDPGPATGANLARFYHDGSVQPDTRVAPRLDAGGNPAIDPESGIPVFDPIAPDGRTNTWNYFDNRQVRPDGFIAFHTYSADILPGISRQAAADASMGMELAVIRDMGRLFGTRMSWNLTAGMSVNDISATTSDLVAARLRTLTDLYSLFGHTPPEAPYSAPSSSTTTVTDASGNPVLDDQGNVHLITTDTTVLIGNEPAGRMISTSDDDEAVSNRWRLRGAYFTFRAGPTVWVPISSRFRLSLSAGAALVYAGTNYTVTQTLHPEIGNEVSETETSEAYKLLPGYFADATLQFDLTERAGFYAGAVFQSTGSYTQTLDRETANYSTRIDLRNQNGVRAGMTIRF
jgi:hypothetical protein